MASSAPMKAEVLALYRSLLRTAHKFCDYNIREYTKRRTIDAFHQKQTLSDPSAISAAFSDGKAQLEIAQRQAVAYQLYAPKVKSIMEFKPFHWIQQMSMRIYFFFRRYVDKSSQIIEWMYDFCKWVIVITIFTFSIWF